MLAGTEGGKVQAGLGCEQPVQLDAGGTRAGGRAGGVEGESVRAGPLIG